MANDVLSCFKLVFWDVKHEYIIANLGENDLTTCSDYLEYFVDFVLYSIDAVIHDFFNYF